MRTQLGRVTANLLREIVEEGDVVGVSWGRSVNAMTSLLEPVMIVFLAVIVGSIVVALLLPLFNFDPDAPGKSRGGAEA